MAAKHPSDDPTVTKLVEIINGAVLAAVAGTAMNPDAIKKAIRQVLLAAPNAGATAAPAATAATAAKQAPSGRWRVDNGVIICGSVRMFSEDFDSYPSRPVSEDLLRWICETLNTAQVMGFSLAETQANADRYIALINSGAYAPGRSPSRPWTLRKGEHSATKTALDAAADAAIAATRNTAGKPR
jgi:hypothetical protein